MQWTWVVHVLLDELAQPIDPFPIEHAFQKDDAIGLEFFGFVVAYGAQGQIVYYRLTFNEIRIGPRLGEAVKSVWPGFSKPSAQSNLPSNLAIGSELPHVDATSFSLLDSAMVGNFCAIKCLLEGRYV